jgi:hypothetical protein
MAAPLAFNIDNQAQTAPAWLSTTKLGVGIGLLMITGLVLSIIGSLHYPGLSLNYSNIN